MPLFISNKDVCVKACTGSGKTLAFVVPVVQHLLKSQAVKGDGKVQVLVIGPSRELVQQIYAVLKEFQGIVGENCSFLYTIGGTKIEHDKDRIEK